MMGANIFSGCAGGTKWPLSTTPTYSINLLVLDDEEKMGEIKIKEEETEGSLWKRFSSYIFKS
jgi:hypothetical protein